MAKAPQAMAVATPAGGGSLAVQGEGVVARMRGFAAQPAVRRALPTIVTVLVAVGALAAFLVLQQPARTTLYASLPEEEKARVVDALMNAGVDVTLDPTTGEVLVPAADYHSSRMQLAALGLPSSVPDGYGALSEMPMGTSRSVEMMRLKQAQEVELARSINEISAVQSARVHLALPERSVFVRDQEPPKASVFVQLAQGRALDEEQIEAIINLVAASVPNMAKENVTVVDQTGRLLSKPVDDPSSILSDNQLRYRMRLETIYRTRIESIVTPIVGPGNVNAQVNIDIDFTRSEVTEERVDPEGNALRSEQDTLDITAQREAAGIPGAVSNLAPTEAELTPEQPGTEGETAQQDFETKSTSSVRNYEVSRKVETTQNPSNQITRIAAAVLVRDRKAIDPETGAEITEPLPPETIAEIERLVAGAIGLDDTRGDVLTVTSQPFVSTLEGVSVDWHQADWIEPAVKKILLILMLAVVALGVIRPLLNRVLVPAGSDVVARGGLSDEETEQLDSIMVGEGETLDDIKAKLKPKKSNISLEMLDTANTYDDKVAIIRMIVSDEAGRVANVFKQMMKKDLSLIN
jgi:flagellar M-ring protein FliF